MNMPWFISKIISILRCHVNDDMIKMELHNGQYLFDYLYQTYAISKSFLIYILKKLNLNEQNILQLSGMQSLDERFI